MIHYSPHFTITAPNLVASVVDDPAIKVAPGLRHATMRHTHALIELAAATLTDEDEIRFLTMKSSDRLLELRASLPAAWAATTLTAEVGIYLAGENHAGAVVDVDLFDATFEMDDTHARADVFINAALLDEQRGLPLWGLLGLSADPNVLYDIVWTISVLDTVTAQSNMLVEAIYKSGGN